MAHFQETCEIDLEGKFDLIIYVPRVNAFLEKYGERLSEPFVLGYFVHLVTDAFWFSEFLGKHIEPRASEIKKDALTLDEITMGEALNWYSKNMYEMFDYHDSVLSRRIDLDLINKMSEYDVEKCPIDEIDKNDLENLLERLPLKYSAIAEVSESDLIPINEIEDFFDKASEMANKLMETRNEG